MDKSKTTEGFVGMLRCLNLILWPQHPLSRDAMRLDLGFILITPGGVQADLKQGGMVGLVVQEGRRAEMVGTDLGNI